MFPVGNLSAHSDLGIGTFDRLDGEMLMLNGTVYRLRTDGTATMVSPCTTTPMATVTFFDSDLTSRVAGPANYTEITHRLDTMLPSENSFYAIRIDGYFPYLKARSVPAPGETLP